MTASQVLELDLLGDDLKASDLGDEFDGRMATLVAYLDAERLTLADFDLPYIRARLWPAFAAALLASSASLNPGGARILALARGRA